MNILKRKEDEKLFMSIWDSESYDVEKSHRRGPSFFHEAIYKVEQDDKKYHEKLTQDEFNSIVGTWKTDIYTGTDDWGPDYIPTEMYRVKLVKRITTVLSYERIYEEEVKEV